MFGKKPFVDYLGLEKIAPIVEEYIVSKNPYIAVQLEGLEGNDRISALASTPQWTYVQIIDQYLTCQLGKKQYSVLLNQQSVLGVHLLPSHFYSGLPFVNKFFEFQLNLRQMDNPSLEHLLNQSKILPYQDLKNELSRLKQYIRLIQEYELMTDNPNYNGTKEEDEAIYEQLDDMEGLFNSYLDHKPAIKPVAEQYLNTNK